MQKLGENPNVVHCQDLRTIQHNDGIGWDIFIRMELLTPLKQYLGQDYSFREKQVIQLGMDMCKCDACADQEGPLPFDEPDAIEQTTETNEPQEESKYSKKNIEKISESGKNTEPIMSAEDTEPVRSLFFIVP